MKNITPGTGGPAPSGVAAGPRPNLARIAAIVAVFLVLLLIARACAHHENTYESIAHQFNAALQANDLATVDKLENAQTQTRTTRGRVGAASDKLAPLGKIKSVKETTPGGAPTGGHEFLVTFEKGAMDERFIFDPQNKVFSFDYHPPAANP